MDQKSLENKISALKLEIEDLEALLQDTEEKLKQEINLKLEAQREANELRRASSERVCVLCGEVATQVGIDSGQLYPVCLFCSEADDFKEKLNKYVTCPQGL